MLIKIITIFLIGIAVLAMFGRLRLPKLKNPLRRDGQLNASKCNKCGSYILGQGPCACEKQG
jgi:hypothetical protein